MSHAHTHSCSHHPAPTSFHGAFLIGIVLNSAFILVETAAGLWADSLALLADAAHNLGDVLGLLVAWLGYALAHRKPSVRFTAGFGRMSIYTTIFNGLFLLISSAWIMVEAVQRFAQPAMPHTGIVIGVALTGIVINMGTAFALMRGQHDINIKGAFLHMLGDAGISAAVAVAAFLIGLTGWLWLDPGISLVVAAFIVWTSWPLLHEGLRLAMDGVPSSVDIESIRNFLETQPDVESVHDLRIWALSTTKTAFSAHIALTPDAVPGAVLSRLHHELRDHFGLASVTLQLETTPLACAL